MDLLRLVDRLQQRDRDVMRLWTGGSAMVPVSLTEALLDAARALDAAKVRYMLIGGLAVAIHSKRPRATIDVDLAVESTADRHRIVELLRSAGFVSKGEHAHTSNLEHRSGAPVQLTFDSAFDAAIARASKERAPGATFALVSRADLIELKERAARDPARRRSKSLQDQADVELLRGDVPGPGEGW